MSRWIADPAHNRWLEHELDRILEFGRGAAVPNGFGWLGADGELLEENGAHLWITARMIHVYAIASLLGRPGTRTLAEHGVRALLDGVARDRVHGGWFAVVANDGPVVVDRRKQAYAHAFVALAAASATAADIPGSDSLRALAIAVIEEHFWSDDEGRCRDDWDETFTIAEDYRGGNMNMHAVEAFLVLHDVTGDAVWLERAMAISAFLIHGIARTNHYRVNEHFTAGWRPLPAYNQEAPGDRFRAFGGTPGHWVEWSRLLLQLRASLQQCGEAAPSWLLDDAIALFDRAVSDAWNADGAPGFVYSVDWTGRPVIRSRVRWVVVEAIGAAYALWSATGNERYSRLYEEFWDFCRDHLIDLEHGSWLQELDEHNQPTSLVWNGKQDIYHLLHCLLVPRLPLAPGMAPALREGLLDTTPAEVGR